MSRLSRLLTKLNLHEETKSSKTAQPEAPSGPLTINIDASKHIVESVTLFRNDTAQVVRAFLDLKLKVGLAPSPPFNKKYWILNDFWLPAWRKYGCDRKPPACDAT